MGGFLDKGNLQVEIPYQWRALNWTLHAKQNIQQFFFSFQEEHFPRFFYELTHNGQRGFIDNEFDQPEKLRKIAEAIAEESGSGIFFNYTYDNSMEFEEEIRTAIQGMYHFEEGDWPNCFQELFGVIADQASNGRNIFPEGLDDIRGEYVIS